MSKRSLVISLLAIILLLVSLNLLQYRNKESHTANQQKKYNLLAKRIFVEDPNDTLINFVPLRNIIKQYLARSGVEHSFILEYLPTGTSIRSSEDNKLAGASLLKIPQVISLYKAVDENKVSLDKEVAIEQDMIDPKFGSLWRQGVGAKITLREAARLTLVESDNTAVNVITQTLKGVIDDSESVLGQLDIEVQTTPDQVTLISARDYNAILKCLYLACYLSRDSSQEILKQMTMAPDFGRIKEPIPDDIPVAHKIGVLGDEIQSDCAIVYEPNRPFTICVMLKANSNDASKHMQTLSDLAYKYINDFDN